MPAAGGPSPTATLLTPGNFEVEYVNITPDRARMIFNSNQDDIDRRHIWTVPVDGSERASRVAMKSIGSEWQPVVTSDGTTVALHTTAQAPPHVVVMLNDGQAHSLNE